MTDLEKLSQVHRALFEEAAIGIGIVDLERNFLHVNQFFAEMVGYSIDELLTMNVADVTHPDDMEENIRLDDDVAANRIDHFTFEKRYIRKDGTLVWVLLTVTKSEVNGQEVFLAQVQDISQQKELERLKEIETLNSIIVTYHHEINNPLAVAYGISQVMRKTGRVKDGDLDKLDRAINRIKNIVIEIEKTKTEGRIESTDQFGVAKMLKLKQG